MNIWKQSIIGLFTTLTCLLAVMDAAYLPPVLTPEAIGHAVFPGIVASGGMSFFSVGLAAGRLAALRATTSDVKLNRPAVDFSFKKKLRHEKEGPIPGPTSSIFPLRSGWGLH